MSHRNLLAFFFVGSSCISLSSQRDVQVVFPPCKKDSDCSGVQVCYQQQACYDCFKEPGYQLESCKSLQNLLTIVTIFFVIGVITSIIGGVLCCCFCCVGCPLYRDRNRNRIAYQPQQQFQPNYYGSQMGQNQSATPTTANVAPPPYYVVGAVPAQNVEDAPKKSSQSQPSGAVPVAAV